MKKNKHIGKWGEEIAATYLKNKGYVILMQNYYAPQGEIDIIAQQENEIIFIEVKTRKKNYQLPELAITPKKSKRLIATAKHWLYENNAEHLIARLDVVTIEWSDENEPEIIHHLNAIQDSFFY